MTFDMGSGGEVGDVTAETREPWERALDAMHALGLTNGLRVPTAWVYSAMGIPRTPPREPGESDRVFARRAQTWNLREFQPQIDRLRDALMERYGLWLHSIGTGPNRAGEWEVRNADAAPVVVKETVRAVRRAISNGTSTLAGMSTDGLTDAQRAAHSDSIAKMAHMDALVKMSSRRKAG